MATSNSTRTRSVRTARSAAATANGQPAAKSVDQAATVSSKRRQTDADSIATSTTDSEDSIAAALQAAEAIAAKLTNAVAKKYKVKLAKDNPATRKKCYYALRDVLGNAISAAVRAAADENRKVPEFVWQTWNTTEFAALFGKAEKPKYGCVVMAIVAALFSYEVSDNPAQGVQDLVRINKESWDKKNNSGSNTKDTSFFGEDEDGDDDEDLDDDEAVALGDDLIEEGDEDDTDLDEDDLDDEDFEDDDLDDE
ncbi:hypothetical protein H6F67_26265 [Microcoleus sp. FACHB-1515]|uniref:hypothetical protein n=1 Tax=Cyanophyceae TaxID=3028117 RepID=UPI001683FDB3|nr:hypothetical protein [Microcoleus sp. FACHB-1515]MBD2093354.1 hypothetical protein [Microcoleus sp. FACHB-1515]